MALEKEIDTDFGPAAYWRISGWTVDVKNSDERRLIVHIAGYLGEIDRRDGKNPMKVMRIDIRETDEPAMLADIENITYALLYEKVKQLPALEGAADVLEDGQTGA